MEQLKFEIEAIQISIYSDIISGILTTHEEVSIIKLLTFSYIVKKENDLYRQVYNGNNKQDTIYKSISFLAGDYEEYCNTIEFIIKAVSILESKGFLEVIEEQVRISNYKFDRANIYKESLFLQRAIEDSRKISDKQFMKEVIQNV